MAAKGYVYVLSNPSMAGLVKIGKTTTSPTRRMSELHSTGVPTPFELEFAAEVADCHVSERAAHDALDRYRVSSNREFFKVSVMEALREILPRLGEYEVVEFKSSHGIEQLEAEIAKRRRATLDAQAATERERARLALERKREGATRIANLQAQLLIARNKLAALGPRPTQRDRGGLWTLLMLCWMPLPLGWVVWMGSLSALSSKPPEFGWVCIVLLVLGFFCNQQDKEDRADVANALKPFIPLEAEISRLEASIASEGGSLVREPETRREPETIREVEASLKVAVRCDRCTRQMRLPKSKKMDVTCPYCGFEFRIET